MVFLPFECYPVDGFTLRNSFLPLLVELGSLNHTEQDQGGTLRLQAGDQKELSGTLVDTEKIGLLQVGDQRIEIVHPLVESMPEVMRENDLLDALVGGHTLSRGGDIAMNPSSSQDQSQSLWQWFALGVFVLLIIEMIFSAPSAWSANKQEVVSG